MNLPPIHPALVHLPLAFVVLSFLADLFSRITGRDSLRIVGFWSLMAALVGGVATVAAGYFDMNRAALNAQTHEYVGLHLKIGWVLAVSLLLLSLWRSILAHGGSVPGMAPGVLLTYTLIGEAFAGPLGCRTELENSLWDGSIATRMLRPQGLVPSRVRQQELAHAKEDALVPEVQE